MPRRDEPRLERRGREVNTLFKHLMEKSGITPGVRARRAFVVRDRPVGKENREHGTDLIHNEGRYANAARAKRTRDAAAEDQSLTATAAGTTPVASDEPDSAERKAACKRSGEPDPSHR